MKSAGNGFRVPIETIAAMTLLAFCLCAPSLMAADTATAPTSARELFDPTRAHTIELKISRELWKLMEPGAGSSFVRAAKKSQAKTPPPPPPQPDPSEDISLRQGPMGDGMAYVKCGVVFDGAALADAGVRFKGHFSYGASASTLRRPFKLDFARFVDGQKFAGLAMLNLNNHAVDPSQARETLSYELFRELGVPAPRTGYALVYLSVAGLYDHEYLGLYTLIEEVDHSFLKKRFGNADGLLLKPSGMRGLADLGDDWPAYASRYSPRGSVDQLLARRVVELARLVHRADDATFAKMIASYLDVDELLRYVAVGGTLANFDSFLSTGHNYYLYVNRANGLISIIPWDLNMTFGGYSWVGTDEQIERLSVIKPYVDNNYLIERVLAIPGYRTAYLRHVKRLVEKDFSPATMDRKLKSIAPVFAAADQAARQAGKIGSPTTRPATAPRLRQPDLMSYVEARAASMRRQLAGKEEGYIATFNNPDVVLAGWEKIVRPAYALMKALDSDGNGRLDDAEIVAATRRMFEAAGVKPDAAIDLAAATKALDGLITPEMRSCATGQAWARWLFKIADANHDGKIDASEIMTAYKRHLKGSDLDFDGEMGGREMVEAMSGVGVP